MIVKEIMMTLFRQHEVEDILGLALLHKHSKLEDNERLTDIRGTSKPLTFIMGIPSIWASARTQNNSSLWSFPSTIPRVQRGMIQSYRISCKRLHKL